MCVLREWYSLLTSEEQQLHLQLGPLVGEGLCEDLNGPRMCPAALPHVRQGLKAVQAGAGRGVKRSPLEQCPLCLLHMCRLHMAITTVNKVWIQQE